MGSRRIRYGAVALFLAMGLWWGAHSMSEVVSAAPIILPEPYAILNVEIVRCPEPYLCVFNVIGNETILGRNIPVFLQGFQAPSYTYRNCYREGQRARRAARFLEIMLKSSSRITLVMARKQGSNPMIYAVVLADGKNIAAELIRLGVVSPPRLRVNWCDEPPHEMEI